MMRPPDLLKRCGCRERDWAKCAGHGWHVIKMVDGQRRRISLDRHFGHTKIRSVKDAIAARDALLQQWRDGALAPGRRSRSPAAATPAGGGDDVVTLAVLAQRFQDAKKEDPDRSKTWKGNLRACCAKVTETPLKEAVDGGPQTVGALAVAAVTDDLLEHVLFQMARDGYAVTYRNKVLNTIRQLGKWAKKKGYPLEQLWLDPETSEVTRKKEIGRDRRLYEQIGADRVSEEDALLAAASLYMQSLIIAGIDTAARIGELLALQWRDVSAARGILTIREDQKNAEKPAREIPMTARLAAVLAFRRIGPDGQEHDPEGYVFGNEVGEPVTSVLTAWENTTLKAHGYVVGRHGRTHGLLPASREAYRQIDLVFRDLRHEALSRWAEAGVPPNLMMEWSGHTSLETLSIYVNKARRKFAQAAMQAAEDPAAPWASLPERPRPAPAAPPVAPSPRRPQ
jgi:integrase